MPSRFGRRSDVYRVVAARFLSRAGSEAAFFVGIWGKAAYQLHASPGQLAYIMFAMAVASILGTVSAGVLVDRHGPRRVLAVFEVLFIPAALAMALAHSLPLLTALVGVWAFTGAPVVTAGASFAPFLVQDEAQLPRVNALIEGAGSASMLAGPALGAAFAHYLSVDWVFVLDAATSLVAALLVWRARLKPVAPRPAEERHPVAEFRDGVRAVYSLRPVRYYVLIGSVAWLTFGAFGALEPLFFRDVVKTGVETLGWINTFFGLGLLVGAALLPRLPRRVFSARWLALFVGLNGLGALLYVGSADLRRVVVGAVIWGLIIGAMEPLLRTLMHRDTPQELVGRVMGTSEIRRRLGEVIPLSIAPALALRFGVQKTLIANGLLGGLIGLLSLAEAHVIDRTRPAGAPHVEPLLTSDEPVTPNP
jgi:MFS family permease